MTYSELQHLLTSRFEAAEVPDADVDAGYILMSGAGLSRAQLLLKFMDEVPADILEHVMSMADRRESREPLQHIIGTQDFMGFEFKCSPACLIPRLDTEVLAETVLKLMGGRTVPRVLDMCTGSGCIITSLKLMGSITEAVGADISEDALEVARDNARTLGADISFVRSDLFESIEGSFDIIVSNPPYIRTDIIETLKPEVTDHEPRLALDGGDDGLIFYKRITEAAPQYLRDGGLLAYEIGDEQAEAVSELLRANSFTEVTVIKDLAGLDRVVTGRMEKRDV